MLETTGVKHTKSQENNMNINPKTNKPYYYKDNPAAVKARDARRMYVNGKEIPKTHPLHAPGRFKTFEGAAFSALNQYSNIVEGHVYIISNPAWPEWYKVGMAVDASDRLRAFQTSSPFRNYDLAYFKFFNDRKEAEKTIHTLLVNKGIERSGEWFRAPVSYLIETIESFVEPKEKQNEAA